MKRRGKKWYFAPHSESISNIQYRFLSLVLAISWGISMDSNSSRKIANYIESRSMAFGNSLSYMYVCASFFVLACCCCLLVTKVPSSPNKFFLCNRHLNACVYRRTSVDRTVNSKSVLQVTPHTRAMPFACSIIFIDCTHIDYVCVCVR